MTRLPRSHGWCRLCPDTESLGLHRCGGHSGLDLGKHLWREELCCTSHHHRLLTGSWPASLAAAMVLRVVTLPCCVWSAHMPGAPGDGLSLLLLPSLLTLFWDITQLSADVSWVDCS